MKLDYEAFFADSLDLLAVAGLDGYFKVLSGAWPGTLGWSTEELLERPFLDLVHPDDVDKTTSAVEQLAEGAVVVDFENRYRCADGTYRWMQWRSVPRGDLIYAMARDVTERRQELDRRRNAELALQLSEARARAVLDTAGDAIVTVGADGLVVSANPAAATIFRRSIDRLLRCQLSDVLPGVELTTVVSDAQRVDARGPDGAVIPVEILMSCAETPAGPHYTAVIRDISSRVRDEIALAEARSTGERARTEFLSRVSHELRTPLNAVVGFTQLLALEELTNSQLDAVTQISSAGRHLLHLVDELLEISKIDSGALSLSLESVDVDQVIRESVGMVRTQAADRGISVSMTGGDGRLVRADVQRLKQILLNFLSNAVKFNRDGGEVSLTLVDVDGRVRICVSDTGAGIDPADAWRLFEPFERLGSTAHIQGTGLGLAVSKRLASAMGGEVGVESEPGVGSTFWVELVAAGDDEDVDAPKAPGGEGDGPVRRILYIEDNLSNVKLVESIIARTSNAQLNVAMQGSIGLELARELRPDLVLLDLHLPDLPGEEVLRRLRESETTEVTPIVILSADASRTLVNRLLAKGATDFMTKPFDVPQLIRLVESIEPGRADMSRAQSPREAGDGAAGPNGGDDVGTTDAASSNAQIDAAVFAQLAELATTTADSQEALADIVESFAVSSEETIVRLRAAATASQLDEVGELAHRLRGSAANFGLRAVADQCMHLERARDDAEADDLRDLIERLASDLATGLSGLRLAFAPGRSAAAPVGK